MISSTKQQNMAIGIMVKRMNLTKEQKQDLIHSFSDGRTETTVGLYYVEAVELIKYLNKELKTPQTPKDKMANAILSLGHEMNWRKNGKIDMDRINAWCIRYGYLHKPLNDYTEEELPTLLTQLQKANKDYHAGI